MKGLSEMHKDKRQEISSKPKPPSDTTRPAEVERKIKRKQEFTTIREPLEKLGKLEPNTTKAEPTGPKIDSSDVKRDSQLISEESLTDLTAADIEEFDYDEEISELNEYTEDSSQNYFPSNYESQVT